MYDVGVVNITNFLSGAILNNPYTATTADLSAPGGADVPYQPRVFAMNGRIGRVRYIAYSMGITMALMLVMGVLLAITAVMVGMGAGGEGMLMLMVGLFYIPMIAVGFILAIRRAHDMGHSGWLSLLILVPLANLWFIFAPGTPTANEYGPRPVPNTTGVIVAAFSPLIFVVVIGILAAISIPAYQSYQAKAAAAAQQAEDAQTANEGTPTDEPMAEPAAEPAAEATAEPTAAPATEPAAEQK
jgi:uncharacterized membrane protein YhaH (DUF805 family)